MAAVQPSMMEAVGAKIIGILVVIDTRPFKKRHQLISAKPFNGYPHLVREFF